MKNITSTELQRHLFHHDSINISPRSLRRHRRKSFHPVQEILLARLTLDHHLYRVSYSMTHRTDNFHRVVFSDEKSLLFRSYLKYCMDRKGEPIPTGEICSTRTKVMVWGGIWYWGRTVLCIVKGSIDHNKYINILQQFSFHLCPLLILFSFNKIMPSLINQ